jgi:hypothetical protein
MEPFSTGTVGVYLTLVWGVSAVLGLQMLLQLPGGQLHVPLGGIGIG